MQLSLMNTAYLTEGGYIFEIRSTDDFAKLVKIVDKASSISEAKENLNKKGIAFTLYKVTEASAN